MLKTETTTDGIIQNTKIQSHLEYELKSVLGDSPLYVKHKKRPSNRLCYAALDKPNIKRLFKPKRLNFDKSTLALRPLDPYLPSLLGYYTTKKMVCLTPEVSYAS